MAIGIGFALDNFSLGIAIGIALGVALGSSHLL